jgi:hypothetical protein
VLFAESSLGSRARCTRQVGTAPDRESSDFDARNGLWPSELQERDVNIPALGDLAALSVGPVVRDS